MVIKTKPVIVLTSLFSALVCPLLTFAQGSWNILNVQYKHTPRLSFFAEAQLRSLKFYNHFHYHEHKGGVTYSVHKAVKLSIGAGSYQTYKEGGDFVRPKNNDEFRLWPQLVLLQHVNAWQIEQRYRLEMRWTSNGYRNRYRYRVAVSYPLVSKFKNGGACLAGASNELFFTDTEPYFERNRSQVHIQYKTAKKLTLQVGFLHQFDYKINDETGRDFLVTGLFYEFERKKNKITNIP